MRSMLRNCCGIVALVTLVVWAPDAEAYDNFGAAGTSNNCQDCHSLFGFGTGDAEHDAHRAGVTGCTPCHGGFPAQLSSPTFPSATGCVGCHGRDGDAGDDNISDGFGKGLRQHHNNSGITVCANCHTDTDSVTYPTVSEDTPPPLYASVGLDPCDGSEERFASFTMSLDNDGDLLYDMNDPDCLGGTTTTSTTTSTSSTTQPPGSTTTTATQPPTTTTTTPPVGGCPGQPDLGCQDSFQKGLLLVSEKKPGKEKMIAKWIKGPALAGTDFGNPLGPGGTAYNVCIYDGAGALAGEYEVARAGDTCAGKDCWKSVGKPPPDPKHKGYKYKDKDLAEDGILLMLLKGGDPGKSKALAKGKNDTGQLPVGVVANLVGSTSVTVQLFGNDAPECVSVTLPTVLEDDGVQFKAKK